MPPNQFAHVTSCTPATVLIASTWLVGMLKIIDVERIVITRVDELASVAALKPSSTARSDANRKTAIATLSTVRTVRRLLRRALGGVRIVGHHDDRLLEFLIEPLQQGQHFAGGLRVQIAGRLVGEQQL